MFNKSLTVTADRRVYIYAIPPESAQRDCSGTVTAVEYCYRETRPELQQTKDVFYILSLTPSINQTDNRTQFTVNRRIIINSTASDDKCAVFEDRPWLYVCCENKSLVKYQIPSSNFTFAIVARKDFRLLISTNTTTEYTYLKSFNDESVLDTEIQEGNSISLNQQTNMSLLLLRFYTR